MLFRVKVRFRFMVMVRIRVRAKVRVRVRAKVKLGLGLRSAKVKVQCTLNLVLSLLHHCFKTMGVTSFEIYVCDVIGRRFEKVKNGHIFENLATI